MKKKIIRSIPLIIFIIVVFMFSNEPAEKSDNTSLEVTKTIVNIFTFNNKSIINEQKVELLNPIMRKIAHFSLYIVGGLCIMLFLSTYNLSKKMLITYAMYFIILYACSDEIHQFFVPGRAMLFTDVLIDSLGGTVGISFFMLLIRVKEKLNKNRKYKKLG